MPNPIRSLIRCFICLFGFSAGPLVAQESLLPALPEPESKLERMRYEWEMEAVDAAIAKGFTNIARTLIEGLLPRSLTPADRNMLLNKRLQVSLVLGDMDAAAETVERIREQGAEPQPLLEVMWLLFSGDTDVARTRLQGLEPLSLPPPDRAWYHLLRGISLARDGQTEAADAAFLTAGRMADTGILRDHFEMIRMRESLPRGRTSEEDISALRESMRSMRGERGGFEAARLLAIALDQTGRSDLAIELLNEHLAMPSLRELGLRPEFLLLLGSISGAESARGQLALKQLISEERGNGSLQTAFSRLIQGIRTAEDRVSVLNDLDEWLARDPAHPLADRMLVYRAFLLFQQGSLERAAQSAQRLLEDYPESPFVPLGLRLMAHISWNETPPRYRTAADYLSQLRPYLESSSARRLNGVHIADCYFLNEDYASASDAYASVLSDDPGPLQGRVFYQRVLSELGARRPEAAAQRIDAAYQNDRMEVKWLWMAEWNLIDHLRRAGEVQWAFDRVESLYTQSLNPEFLPPSLTLRMQWLAARLPLEAGQAEIAEERAGNLLSSLDSDVYPESESDLVAQVTSHLLLLTGEARIAQGRTEAALQAFANLRETFPQSGPAILSYLVESRAQSDEDNLVSAQQSLIGLVDRFPESEFAPIALWEAALNAEQRGLPVHLREAIGLLERLADEYPRSDLVYFARLKQGDLARRLNDFPTALLLYERLLADYPSHPERYRAEMSRADCLMALGSEDPGRLDAAAVIYERNALLSSVPPPVRMEAGFKWAHSLRQQGDPEGSVAVLWLLYERFVLDPDINQPMLAASAGRYWMARALLELGNNQAVSGQPGAAIQVYETLLDLGLPGRAVAESRLSNLR
jgi:tetratricopeptide (TPR) repeat protein